MSEVPQASETGKPFNEAFLEKFIQAIWSARRLTHKNLNTESIKCYKEAAEEAKKQKFYAESRIAQAAVYELSEQYEAAIDMFRDAANDNDNHLPGLAFFFLGSTLRERYPLQKNGGDEPAIKEAIESYCKAIDCPDFRKKNWAHNNLANIYFHSGNLKEAEYHYNKSLDYPDVTHYITHYNLGRLNLKQSNYAAAIAKFTEAIANEETYRGDEQNDYDTVGSCYREMGTAYILRFLGVSNEEGLRTSKENGTSRGDQNFADVKGAIHNWEKAAEQFKKLNTLPGNSGHALDKLAIINAKKRLAGTLTEQHQKIGNCDDDLLLRWWPPEEAGPDGFSTPEERIFSKIESVGHDCYEAYGKKKSSRFAAVKGEGLQKNVLAILRGWGSATPLIEDDFSQCRGGGYFIKWKGKGIVIDPGFDFLRNFRDNGFHMREIDAVVVSHNHPDHNFDLGSLDDIFYEMHKRNDGAKEWTYQLFCDHESAKDFLRVARHRRLHVVGHSMKCVNNENSRIEEVYDLRKAEFGNLPIRLCFFRTKHDYPSYGVRVECLEKNKTPVSIGFTCDTEYFEDIDEKDDTDNDNLNRHLDKCDILVAHISQPTLAELVMPNEIKKGHLGYRGVAKLIRNTNPGLTLLGEFWAGFADMRIDLTKGLKRICFDCKTILPSSIGLYVDLASTAVECSICHRWEPADKIHVTSSATKFGQLNYVCSLCRL